jgi:signal transduction histidine kinase/CheY-like chemotaxis protein/purine-cytosine permease-like protein
VRTRQRIVRLRRDYNQWVANQTLEDYALRFTAKSARRWSAPRVANTALGAISFLALEALGASMTVAYGFTNSVAAIGFVSVLIFAASLPICYYAARDGVDVDLLTRGAGFGYIGSTVTSLIYASFTFLFFGIETVIVATMLHGFFGVPEWLAYIVCAACVVPLVTHGITFISRLQLWTQPIWLGLNVIALVAVLYAHPEWFAGWMAYGGEAETGNAFNLLYFGAAASVMFALITQTAEQVDFIRFLPPRSRTPPLVWWVSLLAGGPGWVVLDVVKLLAGSLLAYGAMQLGLAPALAVQPSQMYLMAFGHAVGSPSVAMGLACVFVIVSQVKINVTNAYAGSIAWSNFFARLTHAHPGRVVWVVFNVAISLLLMEIGVFQAIEHTLVVYSDVATAWIGALVADLVVNKPLGLSPQRIEFKRAHLYDINPVGMGSMVIAAGVSLLAYAGAFGATAAALSTFLAFGIAFGCAPIIAIATGGRFYLARKPRAAWATLTTLQCSICEHAFEPEDMAHCPVYAGPICSLCCSLDARCHDGCKPHARFAEQAGTILRAVLPTPAMRLLARPLGRFCVVSAVFAGSFGLFLTVIHGQAVRAGAADSAAFSAVFWQAFFLLSTGGAIAAWLLVLAQESRRTAQDETARQTGLLMAEIRAHQRTDAALQRARDRAEHANQAKSRYVIGLSHELRSPLNAILGYAQLLERDPAIPERKREGLRIIRRSGEHLTALIEGLLDISKIEAGRIELYRDEVRLPEFLDHLEQMLALQAQQKGIGFRFHRPGRLPEWITIDERRLRQILINLISNAIKFTDAGEVRVRLIWHDPIAEFEIADTGIGIAEADLARIFEPFQRVREPGRDQPGVGLGLTITQMLTQVMGGEVTVSSQPGEGSVFRVKLLLSEMNRVGLRRLPEAAARLAPEARRVVMVVDDDAAHRALISTFLAPLGFEVLTADGPASCLALIAAHRPDVFLLDVVMPGMTGWELASALRAAGQKAPIVMVSANLQELKHPPQEGQPHDAMLAKPVNLDELLSRIETLLRPKVAAAECGLTEAQLEELRRLAEIGYVRGLRARLDAIAHEVPDAAPYVAHLSELVAGFRMDALSEALAAARP